MKLRSISLASLSCYFVLLLQVLATPVPQIRTDNGIEGTVTRLGSGEPVSGARVTVSRAPGTPAPAGPPPNAGAGQRGPLPGPLPPVFTDARGRFSVTGLTAGTWNLQVQANGYISQPAGQLAPISPGSRVTLTGGQVIKDAKVALTPAASFGGRVRDTSDQPLINVPVELLKSVYNPDGQRDYLSVGITHTNDLGEYRMYWVVPGRYYVIAGRPEARSGNSGAASDIPKVFGYAFHPSGLEMATARQVDLQPGADLRTIDVTVNAKSRPFTVRGKVIDSRTGQPPRWARVKAVPLSQGLRNLNGSGPELDGPIQNYTPATGTFELRDLSPGTYSVVASVQEAGTPERPGPPNAEASGRIVATISDSDVNGLTLTVSSGAPIRGRLTIEGELPSQTVTAATRGARPAGVELVPIVGDRGGPGTMEAGFAEDRTFRITNVAPGDYWISLVGYIGGLPVNQIGFIKEARLNGADVLSVPLRISDSRESQLDIVVRVGGGQAAGTVTDIRSQAAAGVRVVIVPDRARFRSDLYRAATTDQDGRFALSRIAPGDYKVFSWESLEEDAWFDPEVIARSEQRGRSIHVTETSTETIELRIIPAEVTR